ncbi:probable aspartyl protease At4g16563 [Populus nigra]|uniref:probable aspartyl protease At4g16563 n=1 Tax=Populus nigra TaxID=3691 RepID=UPI002B26C9A5|nr:probable aspartyl protease At4g16563 [Populus nigra]
MVSVSSSLLYCLSLLSLFPFISSSITIPLQHPQTNQIPFQDQYQKLNHLVTTSLARARHLKNPQTTPATTTTAPLFSRSYGGYSVSLSFGTPPQTLSFIMDTGSDIVWFPCTSHYLCKHCSFSSSSPSSRIQPFIPKESSSSKLLGCKNPKCSWIHHSNINCDQDCSIKSCLNQTCPPYMIFYGSGTTGGVALSETLHLHSLSKPNFLVGCSVFSSHQPAGIAGFGRGLSSLPSQLGLGKFSYCLLSHRFDDDTKKSSSLVLDIEQLDSDKKTNALVYTPFVKNPKVDNKSSFSVYYYLGLRRITVGGHHVKVPYKYLSPGEDGNGGVIIDSGTTFTFMAREAFEPLSDEFIRQIKDYRRVKEIEDAIGLRPCFNVSDAKTVSFPELRLYFKGGADVALPVENYFAFVGGEVACLTVVTDGVAGPERVGGPGMILGNFQMQNFYVEYDLRNERLGFKQEKCK